MSAGSAGIEEGASQKLAAQQVAFFRFWRTVSAKTTIPLTEILLQSYASGVPGAIEHIKEHLETLGCDLKMEEGTVCLVKSDGSTEQIPFADALPPATRKIIVDAVNDKRGTVARMASSVPL